MIVNNAVRLPLLIMLDSCAAYVANENCASDACDIVSNVCFLQQDLHVRHHQLPPQGDDSPERDGSHPGDDSPERDGSHPGFLRFPQSFSHAAVQTPNLTTIASKRKYLEASSRPLPYAFSIAYKLENEPETPTIWQNLCSFKGISVIFILAATFVSFQFTENSPTVKRLLILSLSFGMANVLVKDGLTHLEVPTSPDSYPSQFNQPSLFNLGSFLGMSICLPLYKSYEWFERRQANARDAGGTPEQDTRPVVPWRIYITAMTMHWVALFIVNVAYQHLLGSTIQMMRGSKLLFTCILAFFLLNRQMKGNQVLGVAAAFIGVLLAAHGKTNVGEESVAKAKWVSIVCISEFIRSLLFVYQEKTMKEYKIPPMLLTGMIGVLGIPFSITGTFFANWMGIESFSEAVYQVQHSTKLVFVLCIFLFTISTFELFSISLTKHASAVMRALIELLRIPLVWLVEIMLNWDVFAVWQAGGLVFLFLGFFLEQSASFPASPTKKETPRDNFQKPTPRGAADAPSKRVETLPAESHLPAPPAHQHADAAAGGPCPTPKQ